MVRRTILVSSSKSTARVVSVGDVRGHGLSGVPAAEGDLLSGDHEDSVAGHRRWTLTGSVEGGGTGPTGRALQPDHVLVAYWVGSGRLDPPAIGYDFPYWFKCASTRARQTEMPDTA